MLVFVSGGMCTGEGVHMCTCALVCTNIINIKTFFKLTALKISWSVSYRDPPVSNSQTRGVIYMRCRAMLFPWVLEIWTQLLKLAWQAVDQPRRVSTLFLYKYLTNIEHRLAHESSWISVHECVDWLWLDENPKARATSVLPGILQRYPRSLTTERKPCRFPLGKRVDFPKDSLPVCKMLSRRRGV